VQGEQPVKERPAPHADLVGDHAFADKPVQGLGFR
jgi:hypothetical protein